MPYKDNTFVVDRQDLLRLLEGRWAEVVNVLPEIAQLSVAWDFGQSPHFAAARGYATTRIDGGSFFITLSEKLIGQSFERVDAIIRHEIGHVIDFSFAELPPGLPFTPERRADAIAEVIWGDVIYYDEEQVQSLQPGTAPRPSELGL